MNGCCPPLLRRRRLQNVHRASLPSMPSDNDDRLRAAHNLLQPFLARVAVLFLENVGFTHSCEVDVRISEKPNTETEPAGLTDATHFFDSISWILVPPEDLSPIFSRKILGKPVLYIEMDVALLSAAAAAADALQDVHRASLPSMPSDNDDRLRAAHNLLQPFLARVAVLFLENVGFTHSCEVDVRISEKPNTETEPAEQIVKPKSNFFKKALRSAGVLKAKSADGLEALFRSKEATVYRYNHGIHNWAKSKIHLYNTDSGPVLDFYPVSKSSDKNTIPCSNIDSVVALDMPCPHGDVFAINYFDTELMLASTDAAAWVIELNAALVLAKDRSGACSPDPTPHKPKESSRPAPIASPASKGDAHDYDLLAGTDDAPPATTHATAPPPVVSPRARMDPPPAAPLVRARPDPTPDTAPSHAAPLVRARPDPAPETAPSAAVPLVRARPDFVPASIPPPEGPRFVADPLPEFSDSDNEGPARAGDSDKANPIIYAQVNRNRRPGPSKPADGAQGSSPADRAAADPGRRVPPASRPPQRDECRSPGADANSGCVSPNMSRRESQDHIYQLARRETPQYIPTQPTQPTPPLRASLGQAGGESTDSSPRKSASSQPSPGGAADIDPSIEDSLQAFPWYHGTVPTKVASGRVEAGPTGAFLVRKSDSQRGQVVLCVNWLGTAVMFRVAVLPDGKCILCGVRFPTIEAMIAFFREHAFPSDKGDHVVLTTPIPAPTWEGDTDSLA